MNRFFILLKKRLQQIARRLIIGKTRPKILVEAGLDFWWDDIKIQNLDEPIVSIKLKDLEWNLDLPFWEEETIDDWNVTPREVLKSPQNHPTHYQRIMNVDLKYPIAVIKNKKGKLVILDGTHRLARAFKEGKEKACVMLVPYAKLSEIRKMKH